LSRKKKEHYLKRWKIFQEYFAQKMFNRVVYFGSKKMIYWFQKHFTKSEIPWFIDFYDLNEIQHKDFIKNVIESKKVITFDKKIKLEKPVIVEPQHEHSNIDHISFDKLKQSTMNLYEVASEVILAQYFKNGLPEHEHGWKKLFKQLNEGFHYVDHQWMRK
jgi:hypothetical protein